MSSVLEKMFVSDACPVCGKATHEPLCSAILYPGKEASVSRCQSCESAYFWPVPEPEDIARCYPHAYFQDFFKQYWKDFYKGQRIGEKLLEWRAKGRFLDVGCALGTLLAGVRKASGWEVAGMEYMPAAARVGRELHGIEIASGGLVDASWPDGYFDVIHANNVMEHESRPLEALQTAHRLLKTGGRLQLVLPNGRMDIFPNVKLYQKLKRPVVTRHSGHLFFYSRKGLETLLQRAGFKLLKLETFHFKTALKARGWMPGAYKQFLAPVTTPAGAEQKDSERLSDKSYNQMIPQPPPSWALYRFKAAWRELWRAQGAESGYDFALTAEKV